MAPQIEVANAVEAEVELTRTMLQALHLTREAAKMPAGATAAAREAVIEAEVAIKTTSQEGDTQKGEATKRRLVPKINSTCSLEDRRKIQLMISWICLEFPRMPLPPTTH